MTATSSPIKGARQIGETAVGCRLDVSASLAGPKDLLS
jgi:hypothetical protein